MSDQVLAGVASIPGREASLEAVMAAVAPQVDRIAVSLNGHEEIPEFLCRYPHASVIVRGDGGGGDAEKFADVDGWDGFVVTVDDDIAYPAGYVGRLLEGLVEHGIDRIVGFHGGTTAGWTGAHTAATVRQIRCLGGLAADDPDVNVLGTGALAFHAAHVPVWRSLFRSPNMADVHLACHAHRFAIPMVALAHRQGWLRDIQPGGPSIYESNRAGDGSVRDTRAARELELAAIDWTAPPARPRMRVSVATCARPHLLPRLLDDLEREGRYVDLEVAVYEDPSDSDYAVARAQVERNGWTWHRFDRRLGKTDHGQLVTAEFVGCRGSGADWFAFLPDDVRLVRHALPRAIDVWRQLDEPSALTLWRLSDHEGRMNWTGRFPLDRGAAFEVFHLDGIYLCRRELLEVFSYELPARLPAGPMSSGVGRAMSLRLHGAGHRMYRVPRSLAVPVVGEPSVMNADATDRLQPGMVAA